MAVLLPALMIHGQKTAAKSTLHLDADSMDATTQRVDDFYGPYAMTREASGTSWQPEATPVPAFASLMQLTTKQRTSNTKMKTTNRKKIGIIALSAVSVVVTALACWTEGAYVCIASGESRCESPSQFLGPSFYVTTAEACYVPTVFETQDGSDGYSTNTYTCIVDTFMIIRSGPNCTGSILGTQTWTASKDCSMKSTFGFSWCFGG